MQWFWLIICRIKLTPVRQLPILCAIQNEYHKSSPLLSHGTHFSTLPMNPWSGMNIRPSHSLTLDASISWGGEFLWSLYISKALVDIYMPSGRVFFGLRHVIFGPSSADFYLKNFVENFSKKTCMCLTASTRHFLSWCQPSRNDVCQLSEYDQLTFVRRKSGGDEESQKWTSRWRCQR